MDSYDRQELMVRRSIIKYSVIGLGILLPLLILGMWGCPLYKVYQQTKSGEAKLREAEFSRQIAIQEANAKWQSAQKLAAVDTIRAHGIARSQEIIGSKLTPQYLQWFFIENLEKNQNAVYYIPTEAGLPILEAGRNVKTPPVFTQNE